MLINVHICIGTALLFSTRKPILSYRKLRRNFRVLVCHVMTLLVVIYFWIPTKKHMRIFVKTRFIRCKGIWIKGTVETVMFGNYSITISQIVPYLDFTINSTLSLDAYIDEVFEVVRHDIRELCRVRKCISKDGAKPIAVLIASARLNYCNYIPLILAGWHWLPIATQIEYVIALLTFELLVWSNWVIDMSCFNVH